jgi:hypothetical protein
MANNTKAQRAYSKVTKKPAGEVDPYGDGLPVYHAAEWTAHLYDFQTDDAGNLLLEVPLGVVVFHVTDYTVISRLEAIEGYEALPDTYEIRREGRDDQPPRYLFFRTMTPQGGFRDIETPELNLLERGETLAVWPSLDGDGERLTWTYGGAAVPPPVPLDIPWLPKTWERNLSRAAAEHGGKLRDTARAQIEVIEPEAEAPAPAQVSPAGRQWVTTAEQAQAAGWPTSYAYDEETGEIDTTWDCYDQTLFPYGHPAAPDLLEAVFNHNDFTRWVFHKAREDSPESTSPFALLFRECIRAGVRCYSDVTANGASLGTDVLFCGESGKGKGIVNHPAKRHKLNGPKVLGEVITQPNLIEKDWDKTHKVGSGQAAGDTLLTKAKDDKGDDLGYWRLKKFPVVHIHDDEGRTLVKAAEQKGSILTDVLCTMWGGYEDFSGDTRSHGEVLIDGRYHVFYTSGMQAEAWARLKSPEFGTGFRQRLWASDVCDPWVDLNFPNIPKPPPGYTPPEDLPVFPSESAVFTFCDAMYEEKKRAKLNKGKNRTQADKRNDPHEFQLRIRLAALLALRVEQSFHVSEGIWEMSKLLRHEHHRRTVAYMDAEAAAMREEELVRVGHERADTDSGFHDRKETNLIECRSRVLQFVRNGGGYVRRGAARDALPSRLKGLFPTAVEDLVKRHDLLEVSQGRMNMLKASE